MRRWFELLISETVQLSEIALRLVAGLFHHNRKSGGHWIKLCSLLTSSILLLGAIAFASRYTPSLSVDELEDLHTIERKTLDLGRSVRAEPKRFPARTYMPKKRESEASGSIHEAPFFPSVDLVAVYDDRIWWESEHDTDDTEDDHLMHRAMEEALRRLIELVEKEGGTLKVQDSYRAEGVHAVKSLHKEGRAIDVTCDELGLEKLAKLCWAAGFDWVYNEAPQRGGAHVHASVRADRPYLR